MEIKYGDVVVGTNVDLTVLNDKDGAYLSELLDEGVSTRPSVLKVAGNVDVWTITITAQTPFEVTIEINSVVSNDGFDTFEVVATETVEVKVTT